MPDFPDLPPASSPGEHHAEFAASAPALAAHIQAQAEAGAISQGTAEFLLGELQSLGPVLFQFFLRWAQSRFGVQASAPPAP